MSKCDMRYRCLELVTDLEHPQTKEKLIDVDTVESILLSQKGIMSFAFIVHDKDVYSDSDESHNSNIKKGDKKPAHVHILMKFSSGKTIVSVAKWFGFENKTQYIDVKTNGKGGTDAYLECLQYLTHEKEAQRTVGKQLYEDEEVVFHDEGGLSFREYINHHLKEQKDKQAKYNKPNPTQKEELLSDIRKHGMTLKQAEEKDENTFYKYEAEFQKARLRYLYNKAESPLYRISFYIQGNGGMGKRVCSVALARALVNAPPEMRDDDVFFEVGANNTTFEGYDGQPVIIWNDCRAPSLVKKLGDIDNVYNTFDTFPPDIRQNIKGSSVVLRNTFNIVNCVIPWEQFIDELAGEYKDKQGNKHKAEDKNQVRRRFPVIIPLYENSLDIMMNKGYFDGTREYEQWYIIQGIVGNFGKLKASMPEMKLYDEKTKKILSPVTKQVESVSQTFRKDKETSEIEAQKFAEYGTQAELRYEDYLERYRYFIANHPNRDDGCIPNYCLLREFENKFNFSLSGEVWRELMKITEELREANEPHSLPNKLIPVKVCEDGSFEEILSS